MQGAGLSCRQSGKAPLGKPAFQPYWGKPAVRNDRGDRGNVGIIRSPIRASILPDYIMAHLGRADPRGKCPLTGGKRTPFGAKADEESKRYERDNADECPPIPGSLALIIEFYQR